MTSFSEILKKYIEHTGESERKVAISLDIDPAQFNKWVTGTNVPYQRSIDKLFQKSKPLKKFVDKLRQEFEDSKNGSPGELNEPSAHYSLGKSINSQSKTITNATPFNTGHDKQNMFIVPLKAFGGFLTGYANKAYRDTIQRANFPFVRGECFAFEIEGFSMLTKDTPEYKPGNFFIGSQLSGFDALVKGRTYVFVTIDGIILKEFVGTDDKKCLLRSLNEDYNPVDPIPLKSIKMLFHRESIIYI